MTTRAQRTGLAAMLATAACFAHVASARAAEPSDKALPLTVVAIRTDDAFDQADALTKALRAVVKELPGWSLGDGDFSLEVLTLSLKCSSDTPDEPCQSRIADHIKSDRYLWGMLRKNGSNVVGELHLWTRGLPGKRTTLEYSVNLTEANDEALRKVAADAVVALTGGAPKGQLRVRTGADTGEVFIDGKLVGRVEGGEATFQVPAGPHKVLVRSPGFVNAEASVVVEPVSTSDVALSQIPFETAPKAKVDWRRVGGFIGLGAGAAFGTVAAISTVEYYVLIPSDPEWRAYRDLFTPDVGNVCTSDQRRQAQTKPGATAALVDSGSQVCDKLDSLPALQLVFYPLAVISAGVGAYLLLSSGGDAAEKRTGWTVEPAIGLDAGKVDVTYRW